jgi:integrase
LFNVAIDSKLRGCDLVKLAMTDLVKDDRVRERVSVIQSKTKKPVQFELSENTREAVIAWVRSPEMIGCRFNFPSRFHDRPHISTRQYGRLIRDWVTAIRLEPSGYGTHSLRRTERFTRSIKGYSCQRLTSISTYIEIRMARSEDKF